MEKAHQTYKEKTYLERYKNLYSAAKLAPFLFQTLSALFAFTPGAIAHTISQEDPSVAEVGTADVSRRHKAEAFAPAG